MQELAGKIISRYRIQKQIDSGELSESYLAIDRRTGQLVIMKLIHHGNDEDIERFHGVIQSLSELQHEHILPILDHGKHDLWHYIVAPYNACETVEQHLNSGSLSFEEADDILAQLADALQFAHSHGIVYDNVKPSTVWIKDGHHIYLTDDSLSKETQDDQSLTRTGGVMETAEYVANVLAQFRSSILSLSLSNTTKGPQTPLVQALTRREASFVQILTQQKAPLIQTFIGKYKKKRLLAGAIALAAMITLASFVVAGVSYFGMHDQAVQKGRQVVRASGTISPSATVSLTPRSTSQPKHRSKGATASNGPVYGSQPTVQPVMQPYPTDVPTVQPYPTVEPTVQTYPTVVPTVQPPTPTPTPTTIPTPTPTPPAMKGPGNHGKGKGQGAVNYESS